MPLFVKIEAGKVDKPIFDQYVPAHKAYVEDLPKDTKPEQAIGQETGGEC
jgi:hypothetical protein